MSPILVLGAFPPEIAPLPGLLPAGVLVRICGVGLVDAALGTASELALLSPRSVIFLGTAGAFPGSGLSIGDVAVLRRTFLADASSARGEAALPDAMSAAICADPDLSAALARGAPLVDVATTLSITTSDALACDLEGFVQASLEHLEAYAVARAAALAGVPFAAVLGVANLVGQLGRSSWRAHHERASMAAAIHLAQGLAALVG